MTRSVPEWIAKNDDQAIPRDVKDRVAFKAERCCQVCGVETVGKVCAEYDHVVPLILGGSHRESNLQLICSTCHKIKTKRDVKLKAKVARVRKKHIGLKKPRTIRAWRRFDGTAVYADRER